MDSSGTVQTAGVSQSFINLIEQSSFPNFTYYVEQKYFRYRPQRLLHHPLHSTPWAFWHRIFNFYELIKQIICRQRYWPLANGHQRIVSVSSAYVPPVSHLTSTFRFVCKYNTKLRKQKATLSEPQKRLSPLASIQASFSLDPTFGPCFCSIKAII